MRVQGHRDLPASAPHCVANGKEVTQRTLGRGQRTLAQPSEQASTVASVPAHDGPLRVLGFIRAYSLIVEASVPKGREVGGAYLTCHRLYQMPHVMATVGTHSHVLHLQRCIGWDSR